MKEANIDFFIALRQNVHDTHAVFWRFWLSFLPTSFSHLPNTLPSLKTFLSSLLSDSLAGFVCWDLRFTFTDEETKRKRKMKLSTIVVIFVATLATSVVGAVTTTENNGEEKRNLRGDDKHRETCAFLWGNCYTSSDCCGGGVNSCVLGRCCREENVYCGNTVDCCTGLTCQNNVCSV